MGESRVLTGIDGLDPLIEGGFPRGSLVLLAGNPGTGKTIFGMQFLHKGAVNYGENGIYVSFAESKNTIIDNTSKLLKCDLRTEKKNGEVKILDFATVKEEGLSTILEMIFNEMMALKAKRLVIDSFTAMAQAFKDTIEARIIIHTILSRFVRQLDCTTILIVEVPIGSEKIGLSIEEFVADGVITLRKESYDGRLVREITIEKLRGTRLENQRFLFTLHEGFQVFPPYSSHKEGEYPSEFEPTKGTQTHYPSGIPELDQILGGQGYPRGCSVLYELGEDVPVEALHRIISPTLANFIMRKRGVIVIPTIEYGPEDIKRMVASFTGEEKFNEYARVIAYSSPLIDMNKPYIVAWKDPTVEDIDAMENFNMYIQTAVELSSRLGKNVVHFLSGDSLAYVVERFTSAVVGRSVIANRSGKDLMIYTSKPSIPEDLRKSFADILSIHFKIEERNGSMILFGKKPKTIVYCIQPDASRDCRVKLTPII